MGNLLGSIESTAHLSMAVLQNRNLPHSCWMQEPNLEINWLVIHTLTTSMERVKEGCI